MGDSIPVSSYLCLLLVLSPTSNQSQKWGKHGLLFVPKELELHGVDIP